VIFLVSGELKVVKVAEEIGIHTAGRNCYVSESYIQD
jgi:hypothetical protein